MFAINNERISPKDQKDIIMNTDNFYLLDAINHKNLSHELNNNIQFIPNYPSFEL